MKNIRTSPLTPLLVALCVGGPGCPADTALEGPSQTESGGASTGDEPETLGTGTGTGTTTSTSGPQGTTEAATSTGETTSPGTTTGGGSPSGLDPSHFNPDGLNGEIGVVDCTLSNGDESTCYQMIIGGSPADHAPGPYCPRNIADGPEVSGIWLDSGEVYDADGSFIEELADFYSDAVWQLFDPDTGDIFVTDTLEACEAAAVPQVPEEYNNYCVECSLDDMGGGVEQTVLIPVLPVPVDAPVEIGTAAHVGLALNGVVMDPPAPVANILAGYTIAAFDDCGGHVNPVVGYHYHAATGCPEEVAQRDGHAPLIGYALDGYGIYAMEDASGNEAEGLDECRGQEDDVRGYHYHSAGPGENMFVGCFRGAVVGDEGGGGGGGDGGGEVISCDEVNPGQPCCGDDICGGPETAANCAEDCP